MLGKHGDFLRHFRGDTVHAPAPRLFHELGLLKNDRVSGVDVYVGDWLLRPVVLLGRGDYWQCAWVLPKGEAEKVKGRGLVAFREETDRVTPLLENSIETVQDWDQVKLLSVSLNRLERRHRPGSLVIGNAAHPISPIRGGGIKPRHSKYRGGRSPKKLLTTEQKENIWCRSPNGGANHDAYSSHLFLFAGHADGTGGGADCASRAIALPRRAAGAVFWRSSSCLRE